MGAYLAGLGTQLASEAGSGILGLALGHYNDKRQIRQGDRLMNQQIRGMKEMTDYQMMKQLEMWKATSYAAQKEQMMKAGLNPGLMYGMGGGGGQTTGGGAVGVGGGAAPTGGGEVGQMMGIGLQTAAQVALLKAQKENIEADTANKKADTVNKPLQGKNITADTANKMQQEIILKYGGKEAERQWNINKELSVEEYGAKADEYEARKAVATQIAKLHEDGTMQKLTEAELENKLKDLGLKNLQISGKKLENAILELEKNMQEKFGIDRGAPTWLKMIGRLIMGFIK